VVDLGYHGPDVLGVYGISTISIPSAEGVAEDGEVVMGRFHPMAILDTVAVLLLAAIAINFVFTIVPMNGVNASRAVTFIVMYGLLRLFGPL
jgi:hypothetical protein